MKEQINKVILEGKVILLNDYLSNVATNPDEEKKLNVLVDGLKHDKTPQEIVNILQQKYNSLLFCDIVLESINYLDASQDIILRAYDAHKKMPELKEIKNHIETSQSTFKSAKDKYENHKITKSGLGALGLVIASYSILPEDIDPYTKVSVTVVSSLIGGVTGYASDYISGNLCKAIGY